MHTILLVSDEEMPGLWDYYTPDKVKGVDLIISCGDLKQEYLEFLTTIVNVPLLYVRGNHDESYEMRPPEGCVDIDGRVFVYKDLRIAGLGGSYRYRNSSCMYTERQMRLRQWKLRFKIARAGGIDLFVTHAPARGYGDLEDLPHKGFECFNKLLLKEKPAYMLHGHVHRSYTHRFKRKREHESGTQIINCSGSYILQLP